MKSLVDLPPTTHSILGHLQRCHFICRQSVLLLDGYFQDDPCHNGWINDSGLVLPSKHLTAVIIILFHELWAQITCTTLFA